MQEIVLALLTGFIVGLLFAVVRLPIPAPPALAGVVGIVGIFLGYKVYQWLALFFTR
ncbi:MAG TPA: XapX domain-containing protein [Bacilli bacterium]|nr:XapX domain-containing protein [Bacilli bacterium]